MAYRDVAGANPLPANPYGWEVPAEFSHLTTHKVR